MSRNVEQEQKLEIRIGTHHDGSFQQPKRSDGGSTSDFRRLRRRSISFTPEIGDDVARAVRAMSEERKQNRLSRGKGPESFSLNDKKTNDPATHGDMASNSGTFSSSSKQTNPYQKAILLPSSPHESRQTAEESGISVFQLKEDSVSTWNKVLQSSVFLNQPLSPLEEWNIDFSELTVGKRIGVGFFGEVFCGTWNGTDVAIKVLFEQDSTTENLEDLCNEISILSRLRHPNVVLFLGACITPPHLSVVTEYMEMGSLYYLVHMSEQKKKLSWPRRLKMLCDICRGLMCIHRRKIVHRDLKSANCLVNKHWAVKICDFGLSRILTDVPMRDKSPGGTPGWMAPELLRNEPFTEKCDIFSLGVIMWELSTLQKPWEGALPFQVIYAVANEGKRLPIPDGPIGNLIADCWAAEPNERPACSQILARLNECEHHLC